MIEIKDDDRPTTVAVKIILGTKSNKTGEAFCYDAIEMFSIEEIR